MYGKLEKNVEHKKYGRLLYELKRLIIETGQLIGSNPPRFGVKWWNLRKAEIAQLNNAIDKVTTCSDVPDYSLFLMECLHIKNNCKSSWIHFQYNEFVERLEKLLEDINLDEVTSAAEERHALLQNISQRKEKLEIDELLQIFKLDYIKHLKDDQSLETLNERLQMLSGDDVLSGVISRIKERVAEINSYYQQKITQHLEDKRDMEEVFANLLNEHGLVQVLLLEIANKYPEEFETYRTRVYGGMDLSEKEEIANNSSSKVQVDNATLLQAFQKLSLNSSQNRQKEQTVTTSNSQANLTCK